MKIFFNLTQNRFLFSMTRTLAFFLSLSLILSIHAQVIIPNAGNNNSRMGQQGTSTSLYPEWTYRELPNDPAFLKLISNVPNLHTMDPTMFRYVFGSMPVRLNPTDGQALALVIGQDGTHGAEIAGEPFNGAGTGGRGQHMVYYMTGKDEGVYMNTFTYTIQKQYGDFAPVVITDKAGQRQLTYRVVLPPSLYLLAQHLESPFVRYRNAMIDAILARNPKLEILLGYGGAAEDTIATYLESKGIKFNANINANANINSNVLTKNIKVADYKCVKAELNRMFCFPVDAQKNNLLLLPNERGQQGAISDFRAPSRQLLNLMKSRASDQKFLNENVLPYVVEKPLFYPGQIGKDLNAQGLNGVKGLYSITVGQQRRNVIAKSGPHPGTAQGADIQAQIVKLERAYQRIFNEIMSARSFLRFDFSSPMTRGEPYVYSRREIPNNKVFSSKMSSGDRTNAGRISGPYRKQGIFFGGRSETLGGAPQFDYNQINLARSSVSSQQINALVSRGEVPWDASRVDATNFHRPIKEWVKFIVEKMNPILKQKTIWNYVSSSKEHGYFGVYRGNFNRPSTIILTDSSSQDLDGLITGMALSGPQGRRLQSFLKLKGLDKNYLILNLLPFDMTEPYGLQAGNSALRFTEALRIMKPWYMAIIQALLSQAHKATPPQIITLGDYVKDAVDLSPQSLGGIKVSVTHLTFKDLPPHNKGVDIPRSDLSYGERVWMGRGVTSSVIRSRNFPGLVYAWIAPDAVANARVSATPVETSFFQLLQFQSQGGKKFPILKGITGGSATEVDGEVADQESFYQRAY